MVESNVNIEIRSIINENRDCPVCVIDLLTAEPHGGHCRAQLAPENVDQLIVALTVWKVLR